MARGAGALYRTLARIRVARCAFEACMALVRKRQRPLPGLRCNAQGHRGVHLPDDADLSRRVAARALARGGVVAMVTSLAIARDGCLERPVARAGAMTRGAFQRLVPGVLEFRLLPRWKLDSPSSPPGRPRRHRHACLTRAAPG